MWTQRMLTPAHPKCRFFHYFGFRGGWGAKMWVSPWKLVYISSKHYRFTFWWFCSDLVDFWNFRFFMYQNYATTQKNTYLCFGTILEGFYGGEKIEKSPKIDTDPLETPKWVLHTHRNRPVYHREIFSMVDLCKLQKITYYENCIWLEKHLQLYGNPS